MSNLTPDEIRSIPVDRTKPYNGLTREQTLAIGLDPDMVEAGRLQHLQWEQQQKTRAAADMVLSVEQLVTDGQITWTEGAEAIRDTGNADAYNAYLERGRQAQAAENAALERDSLLYAEPDEYIAHAQAQAAKQREALLAEHAQVAEQLARAQVAEFGAELQEAIETTPGLHQVAGALDERLRELITAAAESGDPNPIPETPEGRVRLTQQAMRDIEIRETVAAQVAGETDVAWRAHLKSQGHNRPLMTALEREKEEADWKAAYAAQTLERHRASLTESIRELPPSESEVIARETAKYAEREQRSTDFASTVARLAEPQPRQDVGETMTAERQAVREAMRRAEEKAQYGEVRSGYGDTPAAPTKDKRQIDEYGDGLGFGGSLSRHGAQD